MAVWSRQMVNRYYRYQPYGGTPRGEIIATLSTFRGAAEQPVWSDQIEKLCDSNVPKADSHDLEDRTVMVDTR
jgi:hypothetical protein